MATTPVHTFECQMYVSAQDIMAVSLPSESGPKRVARLQPLNYEELINPEFRRLLAAFESLPTPLQIVQV